MSRTVLTVFLLMLMAGLTHAAKPIRGFVLDQTSGEPLPVANVVVEGMNRGATTNLDGFFVIPGLESGTYNLHVSYLSYHPKTVEVIVNGVPLEPIRIELAPGTMTLEEVTYVVDDEDNEDLRESPRVSTVPVDATTLRTIPSLGAEMDVLRTIQSMPGVKASSELSSALYVRGGSPDMTLIMMDQSTVYNPSHLFGLFSTFNGDAVKHMELMKGGFPAEYGGRAGSVLEVVTNDGNRKEYEGLISASLIAARAALEGPLPGNRGSFATSFRRTYFEPVLNLMRNSSDDLSDLPDYYFYDGNAKINLDLTEHTTLTIGGYMGHDDLYAEFGDKDARMELGTYWGNRTIATRLRHVLTRTQFLSVGFAYSRYRSGAEFWARSAEGGDDILLQDFRNRFNDMSFRADWEILGLENHRIKTGVNFKQYSAKMSQQSEDLVFVEIDTTANNYSWYAQDQWRFHPLFEVMPGVRAYYHEGGDVLAFDPRLALVYHHSQDLRFKLAGGRYHQFVNLITAGDLISFGDIWLPSDGSIDPTYSDQIVAGVEYDYNDEYEFTLEGYYNDLHNLLEFNDLIDEADNFDQAFLQGEGNAYGAEFMVRKTRGRLTGWFGYSLSWSKRRFPGTYLNQGDWYYPKWDRRHDIIFVGMYQLTDHWDLSAQWRYNTGQGYTRAYGMYIAPHGPESTDYLADDGRTPLYGDVNNYRYPADHRLDLSAIYNHTVFGKQAKLTFSIYNTYNRRAVWQRVYDTYPNPPEYTDVKLLPIVPLVGYEVRF